MSNELPKVPDMPLETKLLLEALERLTDICHIASWNKGWWHCPNTGVDLLSNSSFAPYVIATKLCLAHSELSEALEGYRSNKMDDKLPHRLQLEVELADAVIRIFDLAGRLQLDVGGAIVEKVGYNASRPDHSLEIRRSTNGKKF